jgi:TolB protein
MGIGPCEAPHWSPNGRWIAFGAYKPFAKGLTDLYVISPTGKGVRRVTRTTADAYEMDWSPDSTRIAYPSSRGLPESLLVVDAATGRSTSLTRKRGIESWSSPSWSPNGSELVAAWMISGNPQGVFRMASDGSSKVRLVADSVEWGWQPRPS